MDLTTEIYSLILLEAGIQKSVGQGHTLKALEKTPSLSLLSDWWFPAILDVPWFIDVSSILLSPLLYGLPVCLLIRTVVIVDHG